MPTSKYPFNPQILPGKSLSHQEHLKVTIILFIVLIMAVAGVGLWYLYQQNQPAIQSALEHKAIDAQRMFVSQESPPANLSGAEITDRQKLLNGKTSSSSATTKTQLQSNRALLK